MRPKKLKRKIKNNERIFKGKHKIKTKKEITH